jgi:hypothetical protein
MAGMPGLEQLVLAVPIFPAAANASDLWGWDDYPVADDCQPAGDVLCYSQEKGKRWWVLPWVVGLKVCAARTGLSFRWSDTVRLAFCVPPKDELLVQRYHRCCR